MAYFVLTPIIDEIDKVILSSLSKNARIPAADIANNLKNMGYKHIESDKI
jgi:winged helix-turn-helix DNA-binding protein